LREYALIKLKRKQLIAKLRPSGIRIDVHSARNIDLGNGNVIPWEEVVRIFDQTGNEVWSSRGVDPLRQESPAISAGPTDDTLSKIIQLSQTAADVLGEIRELFGVPRFRDGSDVGDRTPAKLAEGQSESSFNVTDFIPNAHSKLMEDTMHKCALIEWQKAVKAGDQEAINSRYRTSVEMKLTAYEKQEIERLISIGMQEQLLSFKDAFMIRQIKNYKLANWYLDSITEKNKREQAKAQSDSIAANAQVQQASLQQKAEADANLEVVKQRAEAEREADASKNKKSELLLQGVLQMINTSLTSGQPVPAEYKPILNQALQNVGLPMIVENAEMQQQIIAAAQARMQPQEQQSGPMPADQQAEEISEQGMDQPQEEMQEEAMQQ